MVILRKIATAIFFAQILCLPIYVMMSCAGRPPEPTYVTDRIVWTVTQVSKAKYSYMTFSGTWRGVPVRNRSVSGDGYYYKEFSIKPGDTISQDVNISLEFESNATIVRVWPEVPVKRYALK